jgi:hypothetical protein
MSPLLLRALADAHARSLDAHARGLNAALDSTSHLRPINGTLAPRVSPCARPQYTLTPALLPHRAPARLSLALPALAFRLRARVHIRTTTRAQVPAGLAGAARPLRLDVPRLTSPPRIDARGVDVRASPARLMESTQLAASAPSAGATEWGRHFQRAVASNSLDERLAPIRECPALPACAQAHSPPRHPLPV